ncbi:trigger factor [Granulicoccus phenolivorans]|uniref:trigger factor n=1 Tax=Granulicoccus phenolivorans TaxID=266854 RepID=UPI000419BCD5|nr:trigger factor [Granulicoccus phenolivorans]
MPSTVEKLSPSRAKITIEVPFAELKPSVDKAYKEIASQVNIPGFRAGKVPPLVIDQRFGREMVLQQAINDALPELYSKAVTENELNPLGEPEIEVTKLEDNQLVEFTAELDVRPDIELPDLSDVKVEVDTLEVSDEAVDEQIKVLRERFASVREVERPAAEGDVIVVDLVGSMNGEELEEATAKDISYKLGAGGMIDGLDEAVTGLSAGESAEFNSELVGGSLRGERADIKVTVTKVQEQDLPELDDEFAQMVSEFETVEEMRADLADNLLRQARLEQAATARDKVLEEIIAKIDIDVPEKLLANEIEMRHQQITQQLAQAGLTLDQYLEQSDEEEQTAEEFWADIDARAKDALKAQILLDSVADDREVGVDQNDLTQLLLRKAQQSGTSPEQEAQHMMEHNHMAEWMAEIRRGKALALVVETATVVDTDGNEIDLEKLQSDGSYADPAELADAEAEGDDEDAAEEAAAAEVTTDEAAAEETDEAK